MTGIGNDDLWNLANEYLTACATAVASTPGGAPGRVYVSPGPPAWDCEQLTVHVGGPAVADTFPLQPSLAALHRVAVQGQVDLISLTATILRCVPTLTQQGKFPPDSALDAASQQTLADLWAIWNYVRRGKSTGALFPPKEREFGFDPAISMNLQGGFGGWQVTIRVQLDGYMPF